MKNDTTVQNGKRGKSELESVIRAGNFNSQSTLNEYLQKHGLSGEIRDDNTAIIYDEQNSHNKVATVEFKGSGQSTSQSASQSGSQASGQRDISNISY